MALFKSLLGNGSRDRELTEEMRATLEEMRQERARYEALVGNAQAAADRLHELGEPIARAESDVTSVADHLERLEQRFETMVQLSSQLQALAERSAGIAEGQQRVETQIASSIEDAGRIRSTYEELGPRLDLALDLKEKLGTFLDVEKPFSQLRGDAESLRGQVEGTGDQIARLREQHDRLLDAHNLGMAKMEALDRRREEFSRDLHDKERRVGSVEQSVRSMDGVQNTVAEVKREIGTLKAMGEFVAQKSAALEARREAVESALARADQLEKAMRQINAGVAQAQENEKTLAALQENVATMKSLHESVLERSGEVSQLQREAEEQTRATRHDLALMQDETRKTLERFDFENRGLESVSQRVADLRAALSDFENRFKNLSETGRTVTELTTRTTTLSSQLNTLTVEVGQVDAELEKLKGMRRDLNAMSQTTRETSSQVARIEAARPALEAALRDLEELGRGHATVKDTLEQTRLVHGEIVRVLESQSGTRSWLTHVEQSVGELGERVGELKNMAPAIEVAQKQADRVYQTMSVIESRREFVEDLNRRVTEQGALGARVDERSRDLQARMEAAEQRFIALAAHSEEAERISQLIASVTTGVNDSRSKADSTAKAVAAIDARCGSVEALAEKTRALKQNLDQRQHALAETTKDLERASALREEAAAAAQQLGELAERLALSLSSAEQRTEKIGALASQLEDRATGLQSVEKRLREFEQRMTRWDLVEQDVARSLEQISARQGTVEALQADLDRMFTMAEKTATEVREITSTRREVEESRGMLDDVMGRLQSMRDAETALDERGRQMTRAEERLARADALLADVRSSIESLQGQKVLIDQAVEKTGSLRSMLKQAESVIEGLKEERDTTSRVRAALTLVEPGDNAGNEDEANAA